MVDVNELPTPALVIERSALLHNLSTMAAARPGAALRPHVKAHKTTGLAHMQRAVGGHHGFTCATPREALGMVAAGLGADLLVANEVLDASRLRALARADAQITLAVDSADTIAAAATAGIRSVLIDVNIGLPRCGCEPHEAGRLADRARAVGLEVRGVMGYEGHLMTVPDREERRASVAACVDLLMAAHDLVGGDIISSGGTGTFDLHDRATEVQAGSYLLMDTHYGQLTLPFEQAVFVLGTVVSRSTQHAVADVGLKALGMDHGNPTVADATVWFCSDEHITFSTRDQPLPAVGERIRVTPAHVDPTMAMHEVAWLIEGTEVLERWPIDLRGW